MFEIKRPIVCIQGLGFVGSAMAIAVANALDENGLPRYNVIGIELSNEKGEKTVSQMNAGVFPFENVDIELCKAHKRCVKNKNLYASTDSKWFEEAEIIVSDINLDVNYGVDDEPYIDLSLYKEAMRTIGSKMKEGALLLIETTVPPGTCDKVVAPIIKEEFLKRGLDSNKFMLAHSYERVMPGADYYNSIVNYWRVYAGINEASAQKCKLFLQEFINIDKYPLTRLESTTASETAKVLENSYRAMTIAFMEEWGRFAESAGFDLYAVIDAIRMRPTHANMRQPGFGVGGYCLTKDPYFAGLASKDILDLPQLEFPFCNQAVRTNKQMPLVSLNKMQELLDGDLKGKKILVLGVSYRQDVGDTRYSPTEIFAREAIKRGALLTYHDPLVSEWKEMGVTVESLIPNSDGFDAVIFTVSHKEYTKIEFQNWIHDKELLIFDANHVLQNAQINEIHKNGYRFACIGRGGSIC